MVRTALLSVMCGMLIACGGSKLPTAPSSAGGTPTAPSAPAPPTSGPSTFSIDLPVSPGDTANSAYGLWPFGVHGGGHAEDGHPGWDVEMRPGASVLAAADGSVQNALLEPGGSGRYTVRVMHEVNGRTAYATDYTNMSSLAPGIASGARVMRGQVIGAAGVQSQIIGTTPVTWAMTHFQVNDFSLNEGLTNRNAVSPERFLSGGARSLFDALWRSAAYQTEWCEPYVENPRAATFPQDRTWTLQSGITAALVEVTCISASNPQFAYTFRAADRSTIESGSFVVDAAKKPLPTVDFRPTSGASRLGVWDILNESLQLNLGPSGGARPSSLAGASTYTTTR